MPTYTLIQWGSYFAVINEPVRTQQLARTSSNDARSAISAPYFPSVPLSAKMKCVWFGSSEAFAFSALPW